MTPQTNIFHQKIALKLLETFLFVYMIKQISHDPWNINSEPSPPGRNRNY